MTKRFVIVAVLLWFVATGMAFALPGQLKQDMFRRSVPIEIGLADPCNCGCNEGTATFLRWSDGYGYYITSDHAVKDSRWVLVDNCWQAEIWDTVYDQNGCYAATILRVEMPEPCMMGPTCVKTGVTCFKDGGYVDEGKHSGQGTITKVENQFECSDGVVWTNTLPDCINCGAGLFSFDCYDSCQGCATLIGILVDKRKDCCPKNPCDPCAKCGTRRQTAFHLLTDEDLASVPSG